MSKVFTKRKINKRTVSWLSWDTPLLYGLSAKKKMLLEKVVAILYVCTQPPSISQTFKRHLSEQLTWKSIVHMLVQVHLQAELPLYGSHD